MLPGVVIPQVMLAKQRRKEELEGKVEALTRRRAAIATRLQHLRETINDPASPMREIDKAQVTDHRWWVREYCI